MPKKSTPKPNPAFRRVYELKRQAEREAKEAWRVARTVEIAFEDAKLQPGATASEIEAAALAAGVEALRKQRKWTKKQWEAVWASMSPEVAAFSRALSESVKKRPKRKRSD